MTDKSTSDSRYIKTLVDALNIADSWLTRWATHVENCAGGGQCTCGLTRIRFDVASALEQEKP